MEFEKIKDISCPNYSIYTWKIIPFCGIIFIYDTPEAFPSSKIHWRRIYLFNIYFTPFCGFQMDLCFPNGSISVLLTILSIGRIPFLQYSQY